MIIPFLGSSKPRPREGIASRLIPFQLLSEIIPFIGSGTVEDLVTISRLCRTCRAFVPLCQQRIFEKIKIEPYPQKHLYRKAAKLTRLRDAFQHSPHLSTYVRDFDFTIQSSDIQNPDVNIEILDSLVNIAHFSLHGEVPSSEPLPRKLAASLIFLLARPSLNFVKVDDVHPWLLSRLPSSLEKLWIINMAVYSPEDLVIPHGVRELVYTTVQLRPPRPKELFLKEATMDYLLGFSDTGSQPFVDVQNLTSLSFSGTGSQNKIKYISEKAENLTTLSWIIDDYRPHFYGFPDHDFDGLGDLFKYGASSRHTLEDLHIHFLKTLYASVHLQDLEHDVAQIVEELRSVPTRGRDCRLSIFSISIVVDMSLARNLEGIFLGLDEVLTKGGFPQLKEVSILIEIQWGRGDLNASEEELCAVEKQTQQLCDEQFQNVQKLEDVYFDCEIRMVKF